MREFNYTAQRILELIVQGHGPKSHIPDHEIQIQHDPAIYV